VVIDAGKALTDVLVSAFDEANLILLVVTPDIVTLYQTKWAMSLIESLLFPSSMVKGVINRAESRGGVGSQDVRVAMPCEVIGEIPSDGRAVGTSVNQGAPVVTSFGSSKVAEAFRRLADTLANTPDLYVSHQEIPRHRQPGAEPSVDAPQFASYSAKLFAMAENGSVVEEAEDDIVSLKRRIHNRLVEELDLKRLDLTVMTNHAHMQDLRQRCEGLIGNILAKEVGGIVSSHEIRARIVKEIADEALGLGPLEELLVDPEVTDILVNNKDQIYVERRGKLELTTKKFLSNDQVRAVIERIVAPLGRRIDESTPMVDARLPDGSRVNAIIPPLSLKGPSLSIRKFAQIRYTQDDLVRFSSLTPEMAQFIRGCVLARKNILISGGTGSGKTTMLNIVSAFIPEGERIVTIEDAAELRLAQEHWVSLESRPTNVEGKGQITIRDLFRNALRMRPDRIVIGECRGAETLDMLQAMNTGHDGSLSTVHASSPKDVISRLDSMVLMSGVELPIHAIREMVASAIHVVLHTSRMSDGSRKVVSIAELSGMEGEIDIRLKELFVFRQTGVADDGSVQGYFTATGELPSFLNELKVKGLAVEESLFRVREPETPTS
jgi:Flp pilus assembly CpaF family ATPase